MPEGSGSKDWLLGSHENNFWGDGNGLYFDRGLGYRINAIIKTHWMIH